MRRSLRIFALALPLPALASGQAVAGGLYLYEIGGPEVGLAAAGYAARAQDASTVFTNPAGMTRLTRPEVHIGDFRGKVSSAPIRAITRTISGTPIRSIRKSIRRKWPRSVFLRSSCSS